MGRGDRSADSYAPRLLSAAESVPERERIRRFHSSAGRELTVAMDSPAKTALVYLWAPFANLLWYVETIVMGPISLL